MAVPPPAAPPASPPEAPTPRADLLKLYELALTEYRFQVQLNWDRAKQYLVFNAAMFAAASTILKIEGSRGIDVLVGIFFLVASLNSASGAHSVRTGHGYYVAIRGQIQSLEDALSIAKTHRLATTPGMRGEVRTGLAKLGKITNQITGLLWMLFVAGLGGTGYAFVLAGSPSSRPQSATPCCPSGSAIIVPTPYRMTANMEWQPGVEALSLVDAGQSVPALDASADAAPARVDASADANARGP